MHASEPNVIFSSERLWFRALEASDRIFYSGLYSSEESMRHIGTPLTESNANRFFNNELKSSKSKPQRRFLFVVGQHGSDQAIGLAALILNPNHSGIGEIGCLFLPGFCNLGYGPQSLTAICRFAKENLTLQRLYCDISNSNRAAIGMMNKLNFVLDPIRSSSEKLIYWSNA